MSTQLTYHCEGDYMIPNLIAPEAESLGICVNVNRNLSQVLANI